MSHVTCGQDETAGKGTSVKKNILTCQVRWNVLEIFWIYQTYPCGREPREIIWKKGKECSAAFIITHAKVGGSETNNIAHREKGLQCRLLFFSSENIIRSVPKKMTLMLTSVAAAFVVVASSSCSS